MNFSNILSQIEKADPEVYEKLSGRRHVLKSFTSKVAIAALPFAIGSLFKKAYGQTTSAVTDALNFALELEYLEYNFYHTANNTGALIPGSAGVAGNDLAGFQTIEAQERQHILFLQNTILQLGGTPYTPKNYNAAASNPLYVPTAYDFTASGTYPVFSSYTTFLIIAQLLEDTGVHAIKGQLAAFLGNATLFIQGMELQSTEARHAAHVRLIRRLLGTALAPDYPAPWINNNIPPAGTPPDQFQAYYLNEDNVLQNGIKITGLPDAYSSTATVPQLSATAAFDEAYDKTTVTNLIKAFML